MYKKEFKIYSSNTHHNVIKGETLAFPFNPHMSTEKQNMTDITTDLNRIPV